MCRLYITITISSDRAIQTMRVIFVAFSIKISHLLQPFMKNHEKNKTKQNTISNSNGIGWLLSSNGCGLEIGGHFKSTENLRTHIYTYQFKEKKSFNTIRCEKKKPTKYMSDNTTLA